ncbi:MULTISPECIES: hypothetical protein [Microbispora]|uniref:hypothetical protein n=1 Tax=Microbispora TaxID=2005 RepID=UPI001439D73B|nr:MULTISPECIES: hypothetical protein [unclassified Microbispora]NJP24941.1 hypothetical protein [Microbispora sp. CL1-1]
MYLSTGHHLEAAEEALPGLDDDAADGFTTLDEIDAAEEAARLHADIRSALEGN